jgi:pantetheine-phosphate adenylyltransferase
LATHVLFPGSFDPPTVGHVDLVRRAARLFARVSVGVAEHSQKQALFTLEERLALLKGVLAELDNVAVVRVPGLTVAAARELGCDALLRGLRHGGDFDYEGQMARTNRALAPALDTVFLASASELGHVSSTFVRQIAQLGGDVSSFVPPAVAVALARKLRK